MQNLEEWFTDHVELTNAKHEACYKKRIISKDREVFIAAEAWLFKKYIKLEYIYANIGFTEVAVKVDTGNHE